MDEAAPQAAVAGADEDALAALRFGWGEAYRIGWDPVRGWWARRRDVPDDDARNITALDADELRTAVYRDYEFRPVPRGAAGVIVDHEAPS